MAVLLDKLSKRGLSRMGKPTEQPVQQPSPLPTITEQVMQPRVPPAPLASRIAQAPQRGEVGSQPQFKNIQKRFVADLPAKVQLEGVNLILSGQDTKSPVINNFVRQMAAQGKSPEEIIQAFKTHQKTSQDPLVLL